MIHNEDFARKVVPFIKPEYFVDKTEKSIAAKAIDFFNQYNQRITRDILRIELDNININNVLDQLTFITENNEWLYEKTEKFCKQRAVVNAIIDAYDIVEGKNKTLSEDAIPSLLSDALAVSFDSSIGHDYLENYLERYDFYHRVEEKIPFDLDLLNKITKGGLSKKTLNVILASTGVGKSLFMCHVAAATLLQNKNVLYITLEMAEEKIAERIDANLLNLTMGELSTVDKTAYESRINKLIKKTTGKLIVKEYPTSTAHAGHFKSLIEELKIKRNFIPDMIIIDYLNICSSSRIKNGSGVNSYTYVKSIAEELRGLAVEYNVPMISATQTTRGGFGNTDIDLTDTSESIGLPATVDLMLALISTEELEDLNQIMVKQLKNRYNDPSYYKRFVIGVDRSRMKLYDVEVSAQENISDSGQNNDKFNIASNMKKASVSTSDFIF